MGENNKFNNLNSGESKKEIIEMEELGEIVKDLKEQPSREKSVKDIIEGIKNKDRKQEGKEDNSFPAEGETINLLDKDGKAKEWRIFQIDPDEDKVVLIYPSKRKKRRRNAFKQLTLTLAQFEELRGKRKENGEKKEVFSPQEGEKIKVKNIRGEIKEWEIFRVYPQEEKVILKLILPVSGQDVKKLELEKEVTFKELKKLLAEQKSIKAEQNKEKIKKKLESERGKSVKDIIKKIKEKNNSEDSNSTLEDNFFPKQGETINLLDKDGKAKEWRVFQIDPNEDKVVLIYPSKRKKRRRNAFKQLTLTLAQFEALKEGTKKELVKEKRRRSERGKREEEPKIKGDNENKKKKSKNIPEPEKPEEKPKAEEDKDKGENSKNTSENPEDIPEKPEDTPKKPEGNKDETKEEKVSWAFRSILNRARAEALNNQEAEKDIRFLKEMRENKEWAEKVMDILVEFIQKEEKVSLADLANFCGLTEEEIRNLLIEERELLRCQAEQEVRAKKSWKKYAGKTAGYLGAAGALMVLERSSAVFGLAGSVALSGARIIDSYRMAKKDKEELKKIYQNLIKNLQRGLKLKKEVESGVSKIEELSEEEKRFLNFAETIKNNFTARVALKKQEKERKEFFTKYEDENKREKALRDALKKVLEGDEFKALGNKEEKKEKIISLILQLDRIDRAQEELKEKAASRLGKKWRGLKEKFRHFVEKIGLEESSAREKALTSLVFSAAGYLAAEAPVLRQALYGYAGVKTGDMLAQFLTSRIRKKQEEEKNISPVLEKWKKIEEKKSPVSVDEAQKDLQKLSLFVLDEEAMRRDPHSYYETQKAIDKIHEFLLNNLEDKDYLNKYNESLSQKIKEKKKIEWTNSFIRATGMVLGGVAGVALGKEITEHLGQKLEEKKDQTIVFKNKGEASSALTDKQTVKNNFSPSEGKGENYWQWLKEKGEKFWHDFNEEVLSKKQLNTLETVGKEKPFTFSFNPKQLQTAENIFHHFCPHGLPTDASARKEALQKIISSLEKKNFTAAQIDFYLENKKHIPLDDWKDILLNSLQQHASSASSAPKIAGQTTEHFSSLHSSNQGQTVVHSSSGAKENISALSHSSAGGDKVVNPHRTSSEKVEIDGKMYKAKVVGEVTPPPKAAPEPPVSLHLRSGDSLWTAAEKYLRASQKHFSSLGKTPAQREALQTYNIDRLKDKIVSLIKHGNPEELKKYGLDGIHNPDNLTLAQLKRIKFSELAQSVFGQSHHLTEHLSAAQVKSIDHHNEILRNYFQHHPQASRSSAHYEEILRASNGHMTGEQAHHLREGGHQHFKEGLTSSKREKLFKSDNFIQIQERVPSPEEFSHWSSAEQYHLIKELREQKMFLSQELQNAFHQHNKLLAEKIFQQMQHLNKVEHNLWNVYQGEHQHEISQYYGLEKIFQQQNQELQKKAAEIVSQRLGEEYCGHRFWFGWDQKQWNNILKLDAYKLFADHKYYLKHKDLLPEKFSNDLVYKIKAVVGEPRPGETIKEYLQRFEAQQLFSHSRLPKIQQQLQNLAKKLGWFGELKSDLASQVWQSSGGGVGIEIIQ